MARPRELWGRRSIALGVVLVAAAILGGIVLLAVGGEDDDDGGDGTSPAVERLQDELLDKTVVNPDAGISVRRPGNWRQRKSRGAIALLSPSRCVSVGLAAPTDAKEARSLRTDSLAALRQLHGKVRVGPGGRGNVGGIPTMSDTITLTDDEGNRRRILLSIGRGKKHAYLTQVVLGNPRCQDELTVAQVILSSIEYTK